MPTSDAIAPALVALDACTRVLRRLDAECCEPGRSPRMKALAGTLDSVRGALANAAADTSAADQAAELLEHAGAQVGALHIGCCDPKRLPLYADMLQGLTTARINLDRVRRVGH